MINHRKIVLKKNTVIYIMSPSNTFTGGPELLHQLAFYITIENSNLNARIGTSISTGNLGKAYFDRLHKVWVVIEYVDKGALPISITTIKPDSGAVHSLHSIWSADKIWTSQSEGNCLKL